MEQTRGERLGYPDVGAPRLRDLGFDVPDSPVENPEHALWHLLGEREANVHSAFDALRRRLVSFQRSLEQENDVGLLDHILRWLQLDFEFDLHSQPFHRITPHLYLGARPRPEDVQALQNEGITHVVSCLPPSQRDAVTFLDETFETAFIPLRDGMHEDIAAAFPAFFEAMSRAEPDPLLVHCEVGVSRSATLAVAHVMASTNQRFYEAFCEVRARRPQVLPNIGFATQLQRFEHARHAPRATASLTQYLQEVCKVPVEPEILQSTLEGHDFDAVRAIRSIFGGDIPRVVQGVR